MKKRVQERGEYDWSAEDLVELQSQPFELIEKIYNQFGDIVISGCAVTGNCIESGVVCLGGVAMPFDGAEGVTFPCYLTTEKRAVTGRYVDGLEKPISYDYKAVVSAARPEDESFVTVQSTGVEKLLKRSSDAVDSDSSNTVATSKAVSTLNKKITELASQELPKSDRIDLEDSDTLATSMAVATVNKKMITPNSTETFGRKGDNWVSIESGVYINGKTIEEHKLGEDIDKGDLVFSNKVYNFNSATFISNGIDSLPTSTINAFSFTADSKYLAVAIYDAPRIIVYKKERNTLKKLPALIDINGIGYDCSFTADGLYLAVVNGGQVTVFKRNEDQFTKLTNIGDSGGRCVYCSFPSDGSYLAVGHNSAPYVSIYKRNNDEFTKLLDLDSSPPAGEVKFSIDGIFLLVTGMSSIDIYKRSEDTFHKIHASMMSSSMRGSATFSPDAQYVGCALFYPPYVAALKRNGDEFEKLPDIVGGVGSGNDCAFSPDGLYLAIGHRDSPNLSMFKRSGDVFSKVYGVPGTTYECTNVKFSPDGRSYVVAQTSSPYMLSYSASAYDSNAIFRSIIKYDYSTLKGIAIENGVKGEIKKILVTEKF